MTSEALVTSQGARAAATPSRTAFQPIPDNAGRTPAIVTTYGWTYPGDNRVMLAPADTHSLAAAGRSLTR